LVREYRTEAGMTQQELAQRASVALDLSLTNHAVSGAESSSDSKRFDYVRRALLTFLTGKRWTSPAVFVETEVPLILSEDYVSRMLRTSNARKARLMSSGFSKFTLASTSNRSRTIEAEIPLGMVERDDIEDFVHGSAWYKSAEILSHKRLNGFRFITIKYRYN